MVVAGDRLRIIVYQIITGKYGSIYDGRLRTRAANKPLFSGPAWPGAWPATIEPDLPGAWPCLQARHTRNQKKSMLLFVTQIHSVHYLVIMLKINVAVYFCF